MFATATHLAFAFFLEDSEHLGALDTLLLCVSAPSAERAELAGGGSAAHSHVNNVHGIATLARALQLPTLLCYHLVLECEVRLRVRVDRQHPLEDRGRYAGFLPLIYEVDHLGYRGRHLFDLQFGHLFGQLVSSRGTDLFALLHDEHEG